MERRFLLAISLCFLVLYAYNTFFAPPPAKPAPSTSASPSPTVSPSPSSTPFEPAASVSSPPAAAPATVVGDATEQQLVVTTQTVEVVFTNRGARVLHWRLKDYRDDNGDPVDLVPSSVAADQLTPFALRLDDAMLTTRVNGALFRVTGDAGGRVDARTKAAD